MSEASKEHVNGSRFLSFSLGNEDFALPLLCVKEVIAVPEVTPIPFTPPHFLGIMNLRGQVISIVDLRTKFGIKAKNVTENAVIICEFSGLCLGVVVDSINSVLAPAADELSGKPDIQGSKAGDYITDVHRSKDKHLVLFLDIARALSVEDLQTIKKSGAGKAA